MAHVAQQRALRVGHPVKHLQFKRARREAEFFSGRKRNADCAQIVCAEGSVDFIVILEESLDEVLVVCVGRSLLCEDRAGESV